MPLTGKRNLTGELYLNPVKREVTRRGTLWRSLLSSTQLSPF
jgi:hypothetical protein